jgi:rhodanese-related sulfurtransferase/CBS domain-containing protein
MPAQIGRDEVQRLLREGAQLVEVLPADMYRKERLPGAISIPLTTMNRASTARLDRDRPVIVYCFDLQCDLSARAAWVLKTFGFEQVYDYVAGKQDWFAFGLPIEGEDADKPRAGDRVARDVPTCGPSERIGPVRERVRAAGWDACVVVNAQRVVLGLLRSRELASDAETCAQDVMELGPVSARPDATIAEMKEHFERLDLESSPITTSYGELVGLLRREDTSRQDRSGVSNPR